MSHNFSEIIKALSQPTAITLYRQVLILAGEDIWQKDSLKYILNEHKDDALWVGNDVADIFHSISIKQAHSWLGREKQVVIFDATRKFDADAFAAISGIVVGGGFFILLMPDEEKWNEVYSSAFGQRLIQSIYSKKEITLVRQSDENIYFNPETSKTNISSSCSAPFLTSDQQKAVENIEGQVLNKTKNPVVLISDRGRGKSASLGISAARLLQAGIRHIAITAPRLRAVDIVFKHITELLPDAVSSRGRVEYAGNFIQFYSPDQLIEEDISAELLLVDEAAAIPVPLLTSFLHKYTQCIFATTVHGYEGTGRGFSIRFNKVLNEKKPGWEKLQMQMPIRWAENDPLEQWMFSLLCLDAEIADKKTIGKIDNSKLDINIINREQLAKDELLLKDTFSLLVLAHYRTQPSDLQRLLDEPELSLYAVKYNQHVIAIALVSHEGKFPVELSTAVYRGERRPSGHLLAQALTYHCGVEHAATLNYSRIMRIAVHPEYQEQGIGSKLLEYIINYEQKKGRDAIGTSFGLNSRLLHFWKAMDFNLIRIGFKREQTSGEHAAIMLQPLSQQGEEVYSRANERFFEQLPYWFDDVLRDLPKEIKQSLPLVKIEHDLQLTDVDKKDIYSFINYSRNYELCIAALNKLVLLEQKTINQEVFPDEFKRVVKEKVINKKGWKKIANEMSLNGKSASRELFKKAIIQLINSRYIL